MGGLGFINVGFLAAGAAVAVPIVIHLLFRPRARPVEIGTLHFLRVVLRDHARRRRIRRWVLLALRAAAMLLLALLFARPYWVAAGPPGRQREVFLLIDHSASMGAGATGKTPFARAQRQAGEILRALPNETAVRLAYFDAAGVEPAEASRVDSSLRPGFAGTDYSQAIGWARDAVVQSRRPHRRVYLFTDLQRSGIRQPIPGHFPGDTVVEIVDVGRPAATNLAVDDVQALRTDIRAGSAAVVAARVLNAGAFVARDVPVTLALEGEERIERTQTVTVAGRSRQVVRFDVPLKRPGLYRGSVAVGGGDDLPFDDRRWIAFEARAVDRVLLVDGEPGPSVFGHETYYLETALRLRVPGQGGTAPATPYEPTRLAWDGGVREMPDLTPYRVVALCNVADVPPAAAEALARFVASGGGLLIFTGDRVRPGASAALRRSGVLPAEVTGPGDVGSYRFADWVKDHPILLPFADPQYGDLRTLRFRRITLLQPGPEARVLATAQGGQPLLIEGSQEKGHCLLFASAADAEWSNWAAHRLYLPLIHQMMGVLTGRIPEDARVRPVSAGPGPERPPGLSREGGILLVRNPDPAESEVERTTIAGLRAAYHLPEADAVGRRDPDDPPDLPAGSQRPDEIWRPIAWILLVVLVAETFVANRTPA